VFVLWLAEGRFPTPPSLKTAEGEEEERRLFYVAVTRAKDELYMLQPIFHVERDHTRTILRPSRFVQEVDRPELLERWVIETQAPGAPQLTGTPEPEALPSAERPLLKGTGSVH